MLTLHHAWRSSASRRVRSCLEEKGLAYESHPVDLAKMEHHSPEYLKINPNGVIPTLVHDGRPLYESGTICEYRDEAFPEPPLRPADAWGRATMRNRIRYADERIGNLIIFNWRHNLQKVDEKWSDEELAERMNKIPSKVVGRRAGGADEENPEQGAARGVDACRASPHGGRPSRRGPGSRARASVRFWRHDLRARQP